MFSKKFTSLVLFASLAGIAFSFPHPEPKVLISRDIKARSLDTINELSKRQTTSGNFVAFAPGQFAAEAETNPFATINANVNYLFDPKTSSFNALDAKDVVLASYTVCNAQCASATCVIYFDDTGDLGILVNEKPGCSIGTGGKGALFVLLDTKPYVAVVDAKANVLWPKV